MSVEIFLLGEWRIQKNGKSLFVKSRRSQKSLELLKYFIGNRGKKLSSENIVENLWGDASLVDSQNTLRTQIYRLRQILQEEGLYGKDGCGSFQLSFESGYYVFSFGKDCTVDTDLFEKYVKQAEAYQSEGPEKAIDCYKQAVRLYQGEYLAENYDWSWTFPFRIRFRRLYVQSLLRLFGLLKKQGRHTEIVEYFEQAMRFEPLEESLNLCYLEALLELKEYSLALSHYNYITERISRELSVKPSAAMKNMYIKITAGEQNVRKAELWDLSSQFAEYGEPQGALCCELDYFRVICNLEERRSSRSMGDTFLGLATISGHGGSLSHDQLEAAGKGLKTILEKLLRKGDVFTQWNPYQMFFLLTNTKQEGLISVGARIRKFFESSIGHSSITVELEFKPVQSALPDLQKKMDQ